MRRQLLRLGSTLARATTVEASAGASYSTQPFDWQSAVRAVAYRSHPATSSSGAWGSVAGGPASPTSHSAPTRGLATQTGGRAAAPGEGVQLSEAAVARLRELAGDSGEPVVLRLTVEGGGCSGFQYEFSLDSAAREGDRVFEREGVAVVMDDVSFEFLKGATVDFEADLMRSAFVVQSNPNAASSCGCGSSFVAK